MNEHSIPSSSSSPSSLPSELSPIKFAACFEAFVVFGYYLIKWLLNMRWVAAPCSSLSVSITLVFLRRWSLNEDKWIQHTKPSFNVVFGLKSNTINLVCWTSCVERKWAKIPMYIKTYLTLKFFTSLKLPLYINCNKLRYLKIAKLA